jgi:TOBE domain
MLRPEALHLGNGATTPEGSVTGRILNASFLGNHVRVTVDCPGLTAPLSLALQGGDVADAPPVGTEASVWWESDDGLLLEPAGEAPS